MWISSHDPDEAEGELAELYRRIRELRGSVTRFQQALSLDPRALAAHLQFYQVVVGAESELDRHARERIAIAVSQAADTPFCVAMHGKTLLDQGGSEQPASEAERAMIDWARIIASDPASCSEQHIDQLRKHGWSDRAILDGCLMASYAAFINRVVHALGLQAEWQEGGGG